MEKTNQSRWLRMGFMLVCCFFWLSMSLAAQTIQSGKQGTNLADASTAITLLEDNIESVHDQLPGLTEGTQPYENALRRAAYYKGIIREIKGGKTVPESIDAALSDAATLGGTKEESYTSKIILRALQNETTVLLAK
jgi:hypothetical protein